MYSSKIIEIWEKVHSIPKLIDSNSNKKLSFKNEILLLPNFDKNKGIFPLTNYNFLSNFLVNKFQEASNIFSKFSHKDFFNFIYLSDISSYKKGEIIFSKEEICNSYNFIIEGDINLYSEQEAKNIKETLSSGIIFGHLIKEKYDYFGLATNPVIIIQIVKSKFDSLIVSINEKLKVFKSNFIQKFFPKIRTFTGTLLINILNYFDRIKYKKFDIILKENNFNDYIYLIISGEVGYCTPIKNIFNNNNCNNDYNYAILEKLLKGEIIGIISAFEGIKNKYDCIILSEQAEFYRISKNDLIYFLKQKNIEYIYDIKSIGDLQEMAINNKINYLKAFNSDEKIKNFLMKIDVNLGKNNYEILYESLIENILYQKWRTVKLGLDEFKNKLIGQKKKRIDENKKNNNINKDIKMDKNNNISDNNNDRYNKNKNILSSCSLYKIPTGRLNLKLNNNQAKSLNKLKDICGTKEDINKNNIIKLDEEN